MAEVQRMGLLKQRHTDTRRDDERARLERRLGELGDMGAVVARELEQHRRELVEAEQRRHGAAVSALVGDEELATVDFAGRVVELKLAIAEREQRSAAIADARDEVRRRLDAVIDAERRVAREAAAAEARRVAGELRDAVDLVLTLNADLARHVAAAGGVPQIQPAEGIVLNVIRAFRRALGPA